MSGLVPMWPIPTPSNTALVEFLHAFFDGAYGWRDDETEFPPAVSCN